MKKKMMTISLFLLVLLPLTTLLTGCLDLDGFIGGEYCCFSPLAAVPFLLLAVRND